jgi:MerR family redox-sensitive transcriptional activator SoxR
VVAASDEMTIGEVSAQVGVRASTLRYWESVGLLPAPARVGGKRRYNSTSLQAIEMIAVAKRAGFRLAEIRILLAGVSEKKAPPKIWRELASLKLPEIEQTLAEAKAMKSILEQGLSCECLDIGRCLGQIAIAMGVADVAQASRG